MTKKNNNYLEVVYDEKTRPLTGYPNLLTKYLFKRFNLQEGQSILDIGCGRGEFTNGFINCGLKAYAVDQFDTCKNYFPKVILKTSDIENDGIPYPDKMFDVVYSKSVIEHFYQPEILVKEMMRVLKPGGLAITLCPSWEYNFRFFYEDYSHRSPFTRTSLNDILLAHGFKNVEVNYFIQLPILWKYKFLKPLSTITRKLIPDSFYDKTSVSSFNKWIRFSKEIMLLSSARKKSNHI